MSLARDCETSTFGDSVVGPFGAGAVVSTGALPEVQPRSGHYTFFLCRFWGQETNGKTGLKCAVLFVNLRILALRVGNEGGDLNFTAKTRLRQGSRYATQYGKLDF